MDPLTIGVLAASIIVGIGAASWAGLKAWNGWLELKKMELTQIDRRPRPSAGRAAGSRLRTCGNASASSRRSPPASIFKIIGLPPRALLPGRASESSPAPPSAGLLFLSPGVSTFLPNFS